jgi:hypothetical protein
MSDQTTIFGSTSTASNPDKGIVANQPVADNNNPVAVLVGEGRKYKTDADLAKAYMEADSFIEQLKEENRKLREETAKAKTLDEVLERLKAPEVTTQTTTGETTTTSSFTAADVAKIVKAEITGYETAKTRQTNLQKADQELKRLYGDKAQEVFNSAAPNAETRIAMQALAEVAPEQFLALFTKQTPSSTTVHSTVNTGALANNLGNNRETNPGTKEYYNALRRKEPQKYYSQDVQMAMNKAAQANPALFFGDGPFDTSLGH